MNQNLTKVLIIHFRLILLLMVLKHYSKTKLLMGIKMAYNSNLNFKSLSNEKDLNNRITIRINNKNKFLPVKLNFKNNSMMNKIK